MRFEHAFSTAGAPDDVFGLLANPALVAPCLPGARLDGGPDRPIEAGDELEGQVELRVGPVKTRFAATVAVLELDRSGRRCVLGVQAEDQRGNGAAQATIALTAEPERDATVVRAAVDLNIRGRIATFGTATVERVSQRVLDQFAANLSVLVAGGSANGAGPDPAPAPARAGSAATPQALPLAGGGGPARAGAAVAWPVLATLFAFACGVLVGRSRRPI